MADRAIGQQMVDCAIEFEPGIDEIAEVGFSLVPSLKVKPGRIAEAPAAMECRLEQSIDYVGRSIILGRVVHMHVRDDCINPDTLYVDCDAYQPLARLHADNYIASENQFEILKPSMEEHLAEKNQQGKGSGK